jgi:hypothetical protein
MQKTVKLPFQDGEPFIETCEKAIEAGDADFIEANMDRLEDLISGFQDRIYQLTKLQQRAREVRDRHEPSAEKRGMA